jgi:hypothetical protein
MRKLIFPKLGIPVSHILNVALSTKKVDLIVIILASNIFNHTVIIIDNCILKARGLFSFMHNFILL